MCLCLVHVLHTSRHTANVYINLHTYVHVKRDAYRHQCTVRYATKPSSAYPRFGKNLHRNLLLHAFFRMIHVRVRGASHRTLSFFFCGSSRVLRAAGRLPLSLSAFLLSLSAASFSSLFSSASRRFLFPLFAAPSCPVPASFFSFLSSASGASGVSRDPALREPSESMLSRDVQRDTEPRVQNIQLLVVFQSAHVSLVFFHCSC